MRRAIAVLCLVGAGLGLWLCARWSEPSIDDGAASPTSLQAAPLGSPAAAPAERAAVPQPATLDASLPPSAAESQSPAQQTVRRDVNEAAFMDALRRVAAADPMRGLALAREGQQRFPNGAAAAERAAIVVRSLAAQGRLSEARGEAELMVQRYHGTPWALEVEQQTGAHPRVDH